MARKKLEPKKSLAEVIRENWADKLELGGSRSGHVACYAANQVLGTVWRGGKEEPDTKEIRDTAALRRLSEIGPRDVVEAMLAAQMVATHEAAMECFRRASLAEQTFAGRELGLRYGDRLVRSFAALTDALDRHRGKGQQVVRVEHVHVHPGGQAIVGAVAQGRGGGCGESEDRPHAQAPASGNNAAGTRASDRAEDRAHARPALADAPEPALRGPDPAGQPVSLAGDAGQETLPDARRRHRQRRAGR
jgi:hypothetical protein